MPLKPGIDLNRGTRRSSAVVQNPRRVALGSAHQFRQIGQDASGGPIFIRLIGQAHLTQGAGAAIPDGSPPAGPSPEDSSPGSSISGVSSTGATGASSLRTSISSGSSPGGSSPGGSSPGGSSLDASPSDGYTSGASTAVPSSYGSSFYETPSPDHPAGHVERREVICPVILRREGRRFLIAMVRVPFDITYPRPRRVPLPTKPCPENCPCCDSPTHHVRAARAGDHNATERAATRAPNLILERDTYRRLFQEELRNCPSKSYDDRNPF